MSRRYANGIQRANIELLKCHREFIEGLRTIAGENNDTAIFKIFDMVITMLKLDAKYF